MTAPLVVCLGEALVDLVPEPGQPWTFSARPGGAPANVAVGLCRLGTSAAFVGRVGRDALGRLVTETLRGFGVDLTALQVDEMRHTPLALVVPGTDDLDRFLIYSAETADGFLEWGAEARAIAREARILHVGTISLAAERSRASTYAAVEETRDGGGLVSLDVNLRRSVWDRPERMLAETRAILPLADVVKLTLDELHALEVDAGSIVRMGADLVLVTEGERGATAYTSAGATSVPAPWVRVVDTTGAGDAFDAAFLHSVLELEDPFGSGIDTALRNAVHAGSLAIQASGAMESLPTLSDLDASVADLEVSVIEERGSSSRVS